VKVRDTEFLGSTVIRLSFYHIRETRKERKEERKLPKRQKENRKGDLYKRNSERFRERQKERKMDFTETSKFGLGWKSKL